ncbi:MAG: dihydroorotate dehydrogenase electron transfer subunit [Coriobacteriales bacterium]|jgi:dihydroorotate dehydrogenase electron transfer subunit|nr:dihydroorotate dehydrogenase electron transfer subunit [Coriobacteriales bacterium]
MDEIAGVVSNTKLTGGLWQLVVRAPELARSAQPGQFAHIRLSGHGEHVLRRPLSIHDVYADRRGDFDYVSFIYQIIGAGTETLASYRMEDSLEVLGPLGRGWHPPEATGKALLVGGGVGYVPLMLLAGTLHARGIETLSAIGMRDRDNALAFYGASSYRTWDVRDVEGSGRVREAWATDDGSFGHHGLVTELSAHFLGEEDFDYVAACGPEPMMRIVAEQAQAAGVYCEVSLERHMACGIGACLSCIVATTEGQKRACADGPVFSAREVIWQ